jgi:hypothetical protein
MIYWVYNSRYASRVHAGEVIGMVTAELRLLGPPALSIAGRPARLHSAKTLALLAYEV